MLRLQLTLTALLTSLPAAGASESAADLVLHSGRIVTVDDRHPEATALAARAGSIVAVGDKEQVQPWIGPQTRVIDLQGRLALPGFIEGHSHFVNLGQAKMTLDLSAADSWEQVIRQIRAEAERTPAGQWILRRGWHQAKGQQPPDPNVEG